MKREIDVDHSAPVIVRAGCEINAPIDRVWEIHSDVPAWPQWQKGIRVAEIDGELAPGSHITWGAWGYDRLFPAHIGLIEHQRRTVWSGADAGIYGIHAFTFTQRGDVTEVETAESWDSDPGPHAVATLQAFLQGWLDNLKATAEDTSPSA